MALAAPCAGRARPCGRGRGELGRSGDRIAKRPAGSGQPDLSGAGPARVQLSAGGLSDTGGVAGAVTTRDGSGSGSSSGSASLGSYSGTGSGVAGAIVASGYADMLGQSAGTGQCVALAQATSNVGYTSTWSPGAQVEGDTDIAAGTVIATFGSDGTYTNTYGQSHTAIYLGQDSSGIYVEDQWLDQVAHTRLIPWTTDNSYESGSKFMWSRTVKTAVILTVGFWSGAAVAIEPFHHGMPDISLIEGSSSPPGRLAPDAETLHPNGKLQEHRWHNLHVAQRPLTLVCRYANKEAPVVLPDTIDTCVMDYDERQVRCF